MEPESAIAIRWTVYPTAQEEEVLRKYGYFYRENTHTPDLQVGEAVTAIYPDKNEGVLSVAAIARSHPDKPAAFSFLHDIVYSRRQP
jgi:hypothetical protein